MIRKYHNHKLGGGGGGLNAFYWYQVFALDSAVVEVQEMFSSHGGHLTNAMYDHRIIIIFLKLILFSYFTSSCDELYIFHLYLTAFVFIIS